jgi:hypothetical protein
MLDHPELPLHPSLNPVTSKTFTFSSSCFGFVRSMKGILPFPSQAVQGIFTVVLLYPSNFVMVLVLDPSQTGHVSYSVTVILDSPDMS